MHAKLVNVRHKTPIVLGTAGHVDHGKTKLVQSLTGINTDRLKVEQERGITTELGFAHLETPNAIVSIIDAPGHERFVRHMVAGAQGLDAVILVVAADEGVMPQTREHLDILKIVGVQKGFTVLTKCDLVPEDFRSLTLNDVKSFLKGTFLENAPVLFFEGGRPDTFDVFKATVCRVIESMFAVPPGRPLDRPFKMAIDRVFVKHGFGTIVTGTVTAGQVSVGDIVEVLPLRLQARIRGIESHNTPLEKIGAGSRAALNLHGVDHLIVKRGHVIGTPGLVPVSSSLDVDFYLLPSCKKPLKRRTNVNVHIGTTHVSGALLLLDKENLKPGEKALARLRLERQVATLADDPFIVRSFENATDYGKTIGGGRVLYPESSHTREDIALLASIRDGENDARLEACITLSSPLGITYEKLLSLSVMGREAVLSTLEELLSKGKVLQYHVTGEKRFVAVRHIESLSSLVLEILSIMHERLPVRMGFTIEEIESHLPSRSHQTLLVSVLDRLVKCSKIKVTPDGYALSGHRLCEDVSEALLASLERLLEENRLAPPSKEEIARQLSLSVSMVSNGLAALCRASRAIRIGEFFFSSRMVSEFEQQVVKRAESRGYISIQEIKEIANVSRKYAIPLAEYLDSKKVTFKMPDGTRRLRLNRPF